MTTGRINQVAIYCTSNIADRSTRMTFKVLRLFLEQITVSLTASNTFHQYILKVE